MHPVQSYLQARRRPHNTVLNFLIAKRNTVSSTIRYPEDKTNGDNKQGEKGNTTIPGAKVKEKHSQDTVTENKYSNSFHGAFL